MRRRKRTAKRPRSDRFKSGLERTVAAGLDTRQVPFEYEAEKLPYVIEHDYVIDFRLPNGIIVETKGYFPSEDRRKMKAVKAAHPDRDIRLLFSKPDNKIAKGSNTTYAMWAEKLGFKWAGGDAIPLAWIKEKK